MPANQKLHFNGVAWTRCTAKSAASCGYGVSQHQYGSVSDMRRLQQDFERQVGVPDPVKTDSPAARKAKRQFNAQTRAAWERNVQAALPIMRALPTTPLTEIDPAQHAAYLREGRAWMTTRIAQVQQADIDLAGGNPGADKGGEGQTIEIALGLPRNNRAEADTPFGEVKGFPLDGKNFTHPVETIALTTVNQSRLQEESGELMDSHLFAKIRNTFFVGYARDADGSKIKTHFHVDFTDPKYADMLQVMREDYAKIVAEVHAGRELHTRDFPVRYIQTRTKGQGGDAKKTRAFYLKTDAIAELLKRNAVVS